ncbi:hypothetical protein ACFLQW_00545 [Candidatus Zixiibacteriota bacterium]
MTAINKGDVPVWKQLLHLSSTAPVIFWTLIILLLAEFFVVFAAPLIVPDHVYLYFYLDERARASTREFLQNRHAFLLRDEITGWRNRPNAEIGKWQLDPHGARTTHVITIQPTKPRRILFLGSSLINGGANISVNETISAFLEDSVTEAINFGTMMYSLDQSYLAYEHELYKYQADIIVVGLSVNATDNLFNQYIPFRSRTEVNMPFLKPRFEMRAGKLELIPLPPKKMHEDVFYNSDLINYLKQTDNFYREFAAYKRVGFLPFSSGVWWVYKRAGNLLRLIKGNRGEAPFLLNLMTGMAKTAQSHGATVIFLMLADRQTTEPTGWRSLLPDHYRALVAELQAKDFDILDSREALRVCSLPVRSLYQSDSHHFSPAGNRIIAEALRETLDRLR